MCAQVGVSEELADPWPTLASELGLGNCSAQLRGDSRVRAGALQAHHLRQCHALVDAHAAAGAVAPVGSSSEFYALSVRARFDLLLPPKPLNLTRAVAHAIAALAATDVTSDAATDAAAAGLLASGSLRGAGRARGVLYVPNCCDRFGLNDMLALGDAPAMRADALRVAHYARDHPDGGCRAAPSERQAWRALFEPSPLSPAATASGDQGGGYGGGGWRDSGGGNGRGSGRDSGGGKGAGDRGGDGDGNDGGGEKDGGNGLLVFRFWLEYMLVRPAEAWRVGESATPFGGHFFDHKTQSGAARARLPLAGLVDLGTHHPHLSSTGFVAVGLASLGFTRATRGPGRVSARAAHFPAAASAVAPLPLPPH